MLNTFEVYFTLFSFIYFHQMCNNAEFPLNENKNRPKPKKFRDTSISLINDHVFVIGWTEKTSVFKKYYLLKLPILAQQKNAVQLRAVSIISNFFSF